MTVVSQTCWGFKEIFEIIGGESLNLALIFRREGQIHLALKFLKLCVENEDTNAMFQLGYSYFLYGWGINEDKKKAFEWFKKSAGSEMCLILFIQFIDHLFSKN